MYRLQNFGEAASFYILVLLLVSWHTLFQECLSLPQGYSFMDEDAETIDLGKINFNSINLPEKAFHPKIKSVFIKTKIRFRYARTRIISTIMNPDPKKSHLVNFTLRIPKDAFISRFEMRIDGGPEVFKANVTRREHARDVFNTAKAEGKSVTLGLLESNLDFDELSMNFIIGTKKTILFNLIYEERLSRILDTYTNVIHLIPEQISNKTILRIEVLIEETLKITSLKVQESVDDEGDIYFKDASVENSSDTGARVIWSNFDNGHPKWNYPTQEFVVSYSLEKEESTGSILVRNGYFVHFFAPSDLEPLKKHVIFVLDISDSMTGVKINQTVSAMIEILDDLQLDDFFNIITFSTDVTVWSCFHGRRSETLYPFPADATCKNEARYFIQNLIPHGSTNINDALAKALEVAHNVSFANQSPKPLKYMYSRFSKFQELPKETLPQDVQSIIFFFTDGESTSGIVDKKSILETVESKNKNLSVPIFSLGFGETVDFPFLKILSIRNGGFARQINEHAAADLQVEDFYREISSPVLTNMTFKYDSEETFTNVTISGYPMIFKATEVLVVGQLRDKNQTEEENFLLTNATVSGRGRNGKISYRIPIQNCKVKGSCSNQIDVDDKCIEKLFIYLTIKRLFEEASTCESEWSYLLENSTKDCAFNKREQAIELAIKHGYVTKYTSMVMKTKSIFEEEMDVGVAVGSENQEWEWFLKNENPLLDNSKFIDGKKLHATERGNALKYDTLKIANAFNVNELGFHNFESGPMHDITYYKVLNISENSVDFFSLPSQNSSLLTNNTEISSNNNNTLPYTKLPNNIAPNLLIYLNTVLNSPDI